MFVVVMAGGSGTRFWPVSRKKTPKQFLDITGRGPMVLSTCDRLKNLVSDDDILLIVGEDHVKMIRHIFKERPIGLMAEPVGRNTAACVGLGAISAIHRGHKEPVVFLPADHDVKNPDIFKECLKRAVEIASKGGIVTLGIVPHRPETGYGYMHIDGKDTSQKSSGAYRVESFIEKPDHAAAVKYSSSNEYYWNAGIFVAKPDVILNEFKQHLPDHHRIMIQLQKSIGTETFDVDLIQAYSELKNISFDYAVMEKTKTPVYVVPCDCGWSDVGSWKSLYDLRTGEYDAQKNLCDGKAVFINSAGNFVSNHGERMIACLGLKNIVVVDTKDALLIADMDHTEEIREIIEKFKEENKTQYL